MQHEEFIEEVRKRADLTSTDEAERATRATLIVLGEYLSGGEGPDLAAQLPQGIAEYLKRQPPGRPEIFSLEDFLQRVAEEEDIDSESASTHARAVINVLEEAVSRGEMENVRRQFPEEFAPLFG